MPLTDKVAAARKINELLTVVLAQGGFRLKYRITVDPPRQDEMESTAIAVDFSGPDSALLLQNGGELLNGLEHLSYKLLGLESHEHDQLRFDCGGFKTGRRDELKMVARVAAEKVRETGMPYTFAPMNARERRLLHVALAQEADLRTESQGEGRERSVVLYPKDYKAPVFKPFGRRR